jgi:hypothetical protein
MRIQSKAVGFQQLIAPAIGIAIAGCTSVEVVAIEAPVVEGAKALIVVVEPEGRSVLSGAVDLTSGAGRDAIPTVREQEGSTFATLLYFDRSLEEVGLTAGGPIARGDLELVFSKGFGSDLSGDTEPEWGRIILQQDLRPAVRELLYSSCVFRERDGVVRCVPNDPCADGGCQREFCWDEPQLLEGVNAEGRQDIGGTPIEESGAVWLYFSTSRWSPAVQSSTTPSSVHAKIRLIDATHADPSSVERVTTGDFVGKGWSGRPVFSSDGLEMFFSSSRPDAVWWDNECYLAHRSTSGGPWSEPTVVADLAGAGEADTNIDTPVPLPDRLTMLAWQSNLHQIVSFKRTRRAPGDTDFAHEVSLVFERGYTLWPASISCDGQYLFYVRRARYWRPTEQFPQDAPHEPRVALIGYEPVTLTRARSIPLPVGTHYGGPRQEKGIVSLAEHPDCTHIYFSDFSDIYVAKKVSCDSRR